jgi:hypothetical protein
MVAMSNGENRSSGPQFQTAPLIVSAAMVGVGTMIVLVGLAVGGGHLLSATRRWVNEMEVPPSELAKIKWTQAKAAVSAGAQAWQDGTQAVPEQAEG